MEYDVGSQLDISEKTKNKTSRRGSLSSDNVE